jgi:hypothetical protein
VAKPKRSRWNGPNRNHRPMEPTAKAFRSFASRCTFLADKQSQPLPGSLTARGPGIHAASQFLRHADIQVTAMHYADHKARVTVDMGARRNSARPQTRARSTLPARRHRAHRSANRGVPMSPAIYAIIKCDTVDILGTWRGPKRRGPAWRALRHPIHPPSMS